MFIIPSEPKSWQIWKLAVSIFARFLSNSSFTEPLNGIQSRLLAHVPQ